MPCLSKRLLKVEDNDEPTEIVIHVNMLKEGWDVTNLYTIIPLRAANAKILIEQSIGRGLRLPYGRRTGVAAVDRLSIIAHDKFQEIVDEAKKPGSAIKLQQIILGETEALTATATVVADSNLKSQLGIVPHHPSASTVDAGKAISPAFANPAEQRIAQLALEVVERFQVRPKIVPILSYIATAEVQSCMLNDLEKCLYPVQRFHSDSERRLAVILEREAEKWFKPAKGQFQILYRSGTEQAEYIPDFVAETADWIYLLEVKGSFQVSDETVLIKRDAATLWCSRASSHNAEYGGKPWKYLIVPHDIITDNRTLEGLEKLASS